MLIKGLLVAVVATTTPVAIIHSVQGPASPDVTSHHSDPAAINTDDAAELDSLREELARVRAHLATVEQALVECEGERVLAADTEVRLQEAVALSAEQERILVQREAELEDAWDVALNPGRRRDNCTPSRALLTRWTWSQRRDNDAQAEATLTKILEHSGDNLSNLNSFAWSLMTEKPYRGNHDDLALAVTDRMVRKSSDLRHAYLDTVALASFLNGQVPRAVEFQERAVKKAGNDSDYYRRLRTYRAALEGQAEAKPRKVIND